VSGFVVNNNTSSLEKIAKGSLAPRWSLEAGEDVRLSFAIGVVVILPQFYFHCLS
jgi:hypothetical protein